MANSLYLATTQPRCGKSLVSLGIMELLLRRTSRVAFYRPIIDCATDYCRDKHLDLILSHFRLPQDYEDSYAYTAQEASHLFAQGRYDELMEEVLRKYMELTEDCDAVLCEGTDFERMASAYEFDINADIARNLGAPVLLVDSAFEQQTEEVIQSVHMALDSFEERHCRMLGVIVNRASPELSDEILERLKTSVPEGLLVSVIPKDDLLHAPTLEEIANHLGADVLHGGDRLASFQAYRYSIAAMNMHHYLERLTDNILVITPGDRGAIIVAALLANRSTTYPNISGIVLTAGHRPAPSIVRLFEGLRSPVPILSVNSQTYEVATQLSRIHSHLTADNHRKIGVAMRNFEMHVDTRSLAEHVISGSSPATMTPKMFEYNLIQRARRSKQHIVLPEGNDERILRAAEHVLNRGIVDVTLLGNETEVRQTIAHLGLNLDAPIVDPTKSPHYDEYVETFLELRRHKGIVRDVARDAMSDVSFFGTMMVHLGHADGMVSGAAHTTQATLRPAFQIIGTSPGFSVVSSVFLMCLADRVLVYGDCAVNPKPNAAQLAEIAVAAADTGHAFGIEPR
ncbi:MAG: phosphate acetyltransferase, partial [Proteobacteria bacterium]|nr:phosphate acetyltransferase [Pseudomonadota bacterium]